VIFADKATGLPSKSVKKMITTTPREGNILTEHGRAPFADPLARYIAM
jgi:hypothetical protein